MQGCIVFLLDPYMQEVIMKILMGVAIILLGAFLTETALAYKVTLAILCGFIGTYLATDAYIRLLNRE